MNRERVRLLVAALAVAAATILLFWPATRAAFLNWDDNIYLTGLQKQSGVTWAFTAVQPFYYHPLTWASYRLDQLLGGLDPVRFHATNVLLHGANAALVVVLAWMMLGAVRAPRPTNDAGRAGCPQPAAAARLVVAAGIGLVFGVHPLQVESVAWVAERKTLLCGLFSFAAACVYLRGWRPATAILFAAALLAKPAAMTLPLALLALDVCPLRRPERESWRRLIGEKWALWLLAAACLVATVIAQHREEAMMAWADHGLYPRALTAARGVVFYLWKLAWPAWLSPFYPLGGGISLSSAEFWAPVALCAGMTALAAALWRRATVVPVAWAAYVALVLPTLGLGQAGSQAVADRFAYLAVVPVLLALAFGGVVLARRFTRVGGVALAVFVAVWALFLAKQTRAQIPVWRDTETMWRKALLHYPQSGTANAQIAAELARQERYAEAEPFAELGFEKRPEHPAAQWAYEQVALDHARAAAQARDFAAVRTFAEQALRASPNSAEGHAMRGLAMLKTGQYEPAAQELKKALRVEPKLPAARYNLACAYSRLGRLDEAFEALREFLEAHPDAAGLVVSDAELDALRADPAFGARMVELLRAVTNK